VQSLTPPASFHDTGDGADRPFVLQDNQPLSPAPVDGIPGRRRRHRHNGSAALDAPFARRHELIER